MKKLLMLWRVGRTDLRLIWFAFLHPDRPRWLRPATLALLLYAISPLSYAVPVIGLVDDLVVVPMLLHWLTTLLPVHIRQGQQAPFMHH